MHDLAARIAENLARVREQVAAAALASGRTADAVRLVAVTKYVGPAEIEALLQAGCRDLGESRPQALWQRTAEFQRPDLRWHLIGHLQRNKVQRTLPCTALIHSVDSVRLLTAIDHAAAQLEKPADMLLEVNTSGDASKGGFSPEQIEPLLVTAEEYQHVRIRGLMTMASLTGGADVARRNFASLRALRDRLRVSVPPNVSLDELSMGMSGDFEPAIAEGATIVRIGSALFEP